MTGIWEHEGNVENTSRQRVFSTFLECSQMSGVFYHSLYNQINARALIGQSALGYCAGKPTEKLHVFWIIM